ncbi:MAG: hypothetical protein H7256_00885 [Bdellovibrio sp.]|nr:hypothetical protein [Bdellovibrio sp.]
MAGNSNLELEIHSLFMEGSTPDHICNEILAKFEKSEVLSSSETQGVSHFLISAGRFDLLFKFYLNSLRRNSISSFPWGYLAYALKEISGQVPEVILDLIDVALKDPNIDSSTYRMQELLDQLPKVAEHEKNLRQQFTMEQLELKNKLILQLNHNRLYQLSEQEELVIKQLVKNFPNDAEIRLLHQAHLEKKADEILSRVRSQRQSTPSHRSSAISSPEGEEFIAQVKTQIQRLANEYQGTYPEQIYNLALMCMNFELYDFSYDLLMQGPETFAGEWLKAEILFESGRHLDLLKHIENLEKNLTTTPDSTYGAIYLKAQAYFGLGQKDMAIQMLEALSQARPSYRSTEALLHQWRTS